MLLTEHGKWNIKNKEVDLNGALLLPLRDASSCCNSWDTFPELEIHCTETTRWGPIAHILLFQSVYLALHFRSSWILGPTYNRVRNFWHRQKMNMLPYLSVTALKILLGRVGIVLCCFWGHVSFHSYLAGSIWVEEEDILYYNILYLLPFYCLCSGISLPWF